MVDRSRTLALRGSRMRVRAYGLGVHVRCQDIVASGKGPGDESEFAAAVRAGDATGAATGVGQVGGA